MAYIVSDAQSDIYEKWWGRKIDTGYQPASVLDIQGTLRGQLAKLTVTSDFPLNTYRPAFLWKFQGYARPLWTDMLLVNQSVAAANVALVLLPVDWNPGDPYRDFLRAFGFTDGTSPSQVIGLEGESSIMILPGDYLALWNDASGAPANNFEMWCVTLYVK